MSWTNARKAVTDVLKDYSGEPEIFAENFPVPNGVSAGEWVRWSVRPASIVDPEIGGTRERVVGTVYFQHFVPENVGTYQATVFADKIGAMFNRLRSVSNGGVMSFDRALLQYAGAIDGKVQHNVTVAFRWDSEAVNA